MDLQQVGKMVIVLGLVVVVLGAGLWLVGRLGGLPRLPGDLVIQRPGFTVYLPLGTSIALSILLTLVMWLVLSRRP